MTWPVSYGDVPSAGNFPESDGMTDEDLMKMLGGFADERHTGTRRNVDFTEYKEECRVGYRHYNVAKVAVAYPFGAGLSYTRFKESRLHKTVADDGTPAVALRVTNTGQRPGKHIVQIYSDNRGTLTTTAANGTSTLAGFAKTRLLSPGESETIAINLTINQQTK